jgi:hypothetical protein
VDVAGLAAEVVLGVGLEREATSLAVPRNLAARGAMGGKARMVRLDPIRKQRRSKHPSCGTGRRSGSIRLRARTWSSSWNCAPSVPDDGAIAPKLA